MLTAVFSFTFILLVLDNFDLACVPFPMYLTLHLLNEVNLLTPEFFFLILAHSVY